MKQMSDQVRTELLGRRLEAARLLEAGLSQAEVARRLAVSRQAVSRWSRAVRMGGIAALDKSPSFGRPRMLNEQQLSELSAHVTSMWRLTSSKLCDTIENLFGVDISLSSAGRIGRLIAERKEAAAASPLAVAKKIQPGRVI